MYNDWINKIKYYYRSGTEGVKIIYIFIISSFVYWIFNFILMNLTGFSLEPVIFLSADKFIPYIWTLFTFPIVQKNLWDLFFAMIMLYFTEKIFRIYFNGNSFIKFFVLGNIFGGIIFLLSSLLTGYTYIFLNGVIVGIYSVLFAVISYNPRMPVSLFPLPVQFPIYVLGIIFIVLDAFSTLSSSSLTMNVFIARIAAAAFGFFYMKSFQTGNDFLGKIVPNFNTFYKIFSFIKVRIFSSKNRKKEKFQYQSTKSGVLTNKNFNENKIENQKKIDAILDKISKYGYENLTKEEKEYLFNSSKKL